MNIQSSAGVSNGNPSTKTSSLFDTHRKYLQDYWSDTTSLIGAYVRNRTRQCLAAYSANPLLVAEHANIERATAQGGYGRRQIYELVQNGADALLKTSKGTIHVRLTPTTLYCANQGEPVDEAGVDAILSSHISMKRGLEIGRFGLGFKSVLGVTDRPEIYSRSGSFGFNAADAATQIQSIIPNAERMPTLRIARSLDPLQAAASDPNLAEFMIWATTIIKLPLRRQAVAWLTQDIARFPAEFLLFSPHVSNLVLEDNVMGQQRNIRVQADLNRIQLAEGDNASTWKVFSTIHKPSVKAKSDAGELSDRDELPVMWAAPMQGRATRGKFWAFFPTEYFTTLSGIVNAPWKTNEDRQNLLTGTFNEELIDTAAKLIAENLNALIDHNEPGRYLDLLPARGREAPNWADELITDLVYKHAANVPSVPDQEGILRHASQILLHPPGVSREALEIWSQYQRRPRNWCHATVETRERRSRAERLIEMVGGRSQTIIAWLEAIAADRTVKASLVAIKTAATVIGANPAFRTEIEKASILLTTTDALVPPKQGTIFLIGADEALAPNVALVHPDIVADKDGLAALQTLNIREVDASSELEVLLQRRSFESMREAEWRTFWELVRRASLAQVIELVKRYKGTILNVRVRTVAGDYRPLYCTLLPGPIVPADGSRDGKVAVDTTYHTAELAVLRELGAVSEPIMNGSDTREGWFSIYKDERILSYLERIPRANRRPREDFLTFDQTRFAGPLHPLFDLSDEGRRRFTDRLLLASADEKPWVLWHSTQRAAYPVVDDSSPSLWIIRREGRLQTSLGLRTITACVGPQFRGWAKILPVADCTEQTALRLHLPKYLEDLSSQQWTAGFQTAEVIDDARIVGNFYAAAARRNVVQPERLRCQVGTRYEVRPAVTITVITEQDKTDLLSELLVPFLIVPSQEEVQILTERWRLLPIEKSLKIDVYPLPSGSETLLADKFPSFHSKLGSDYSDLTLVPCASLRIEILTPDGKRGEERETVFSGNTIYFMDKIEDAALLDKLMDILKVVLSAAERTAILEHRKLAAQRERVHEIRRHKAPEAKLLAAVGVEALRRRLPSGLLAAAEQTQRFPLTDLKLAELTLGVYGVDTLHIFRDDLRAAGLEPPVVWAGSHMAQSFVRMLGFPREYAGFSQARRDPALEVEGPPNLPPLHEFQRTITDAIHALLIGKDKKRGLLSLPTGAGKTRVAVEALIDGLREGILSGPILWIAQTDELCEQAVQTWSYVWRAVGPEARLTVNRLWATNEADSSGSVFQVVVATIAKLQGCIGDAAYEWLSDAKCVIVDEAHSAVGPSYTKVLDWLGLGRGVDRCPLIGLTATPFRGNEHETQQLVARFGKRRLDDGSLGDDSYRTLQDMRVLAEVDHELLLGSTLKLSEKELDELRRTRLFPTAAGDRVGADVTRNKTLLESILRLPKDWPVLLFAASVDHAQTMAALLNAENISAAAISSTSDMGARRHYIEMFRTGRLRVLTNYGVLTAGFDAPATRAIYVARPTYSPVLYQQMIGRGLRGPLNGGKERCLIVNVKDNVLQYGEDLAFRRFDYLWNKT